MSSSLTDEQYRKKMQRRKEVQNKRIAEAIPEKGLIIVNTGNGSGGCIPEAHLDTPVDYDSLGALGSIMGSGGMIVMDERDCMVNVAKYFIDFTKDESCGKCTPCREGTLRMMEMLEDITYGNGREEDIDKLSKMSGLIKKTSLCGLGNTAPTRCFPPSAISGMNTRRISWRKDARPRSASP